MLSYSDALKVIHSRNNFSLPAELGRISALLERLDNPQNKFKAVHIAGTNGKGSVATMTAEVFKTAGYKVGLFTSPYIVEFRERIRINGEYIPKDELALLTEKVLDIGIEVSEFEMITAIGFLYFAKEKCDVAVIETGLGGRLDATNTILNPLVSVITKIGLDHTAILGDTLEKIALEKAGIIKSAPVVTVPNQKKSVIDIFKAHTVSLTVPSSDDISVTRSDLSGNTFTYKGDEFETRLAGAFQIENAVTAIETVRKSGLKVTLSDLQSGIKSAYFPARLESFKNRKILLDGAHNPDGAIVLAEAMKPFDGKAVAIVGMMKDKEYSAVLKKTLPFCKKVITVKAADMPRALSANELKSAAEKYCKDVFTAESYSEALEIAQKESGSDKIFIFGSLYLASSIRPLLLKL